MLIFVGVGLLLECSSAGSSSQQAQSSAQESELSERQKRVSSFSADNLFDGLQDYISNSKTDLVLRRCPPKKSETAGYLSSDSVAA